MSDPWWHQAQCKDRPDRTEDFCLGDKTHPRTWSLDARIRLNELRQDYCWRCPVRVECLADGMREAYTIRGGLTPAERNEILQLTCRCGRPIDPKNLLDHKNLCTNCDRSNFARRVS